MFVSTERDPGMSTRRSIENCVDQPKRGRLRFHHRIGKYLDCFHELIGLQTKSKDNSSQKISITLQIYWLIIAIQ
jgi:hypothetical protein